MAKTRKNEKLTIRERNFVNLISLFETTNEPYKLVDVYNLAGYSAQGKTASTEASRILNKPHIQQALARARRKREKLVTMSAAEIIADQEKIIKTNITDVITWDAREVKLRPSHQIPRDKLIGIKCINITENKYTTKKGQSGVRRITRVELYDKVAVLSLLADIKNIRRHGDKTADMVSLAKALLEASTEKKSTENGDRI